MSTSINSGDEFVKDFDYGKLKDRNYKGDDYKPNADIVKGPMNDRKCTDCLFLILWFVFLGAMGYMTILGYTNGETAKMLAPIAPPGVICGFTPGYENYPRLYAPNLAAAVTPSISNFFEYGTCVQECPQEANVTIVCQDQTYCDSYPVYETHEVVQYCIPAANALADVFYNKGTDGTFSSSNYFLAMYESRWVILTSVGISLVVAFIYLKIMDWCAVFIAWITIAIIEICLIALGYGAWYYKNQIELTHGESTSQSDTLFWIAISMWSVALIYYLILACNWKSLKISIAVIETAADFFADTKRIALVPLFYFVIWCGVFVAWAWALCGVASISDSEITVSSVQFQTKDVHRGENTNWCIAGMVIGMVWISAFIIAANEFAVICAACTWYFSRKDIPDDDGIPGDSDVMKGFWWTYRYHMGTLAMGSFLLTGVWIIRAIFEYVGEKVKDASGGNKCVECSLACIRCCLDCFDRFIRYLNRNAYIYCAISSESFCPSALHSFLLILKNHAKFAFVEGIADFFMFLAKTFIAVLTTMGGYLLLAPMTGIKVDPIMPCVFMFFFAYLVASQFISIFDVSANTILQCYLFDVDVAKHHGEGTLDTRHVPASLMKFIAQYGEEANPNQARVNKTDDMNQNLLA